MGGPRNLAIIIASPFPHASGGRETWLAGMLPALAGAGYRTTIYTRPSDAPVVHDIAGVANLRIRPIATRGIGPRPVRLAMGNLPVALDLRQFARRVERALDDDGFAGGAVLALGAIIETSPALRLRQRHPATRVGCAVHGYVARELGRTFPWARPLLGRMERQSLRACDLVTANGDDSRVYLAERGIDAVVVPNGVDVARFAAAPAALPPALTGARARGEAILTSIATLREVKGVRPFLAALPLLRAAYGDSFRAVFVGKGDPEPYRRYARALGIGDRVLFAGEQRDVVPWLHGSDISLNLTTGAGILLAAVESMAAGVPVIAWDSPQFRQFIEHERSGLLVAENDAAALAAALERLLRDPELRARLAAAGQDAARRYDRSVTRARLLEALDRLYER